MNILGTIKVSFVAAVFDDRGLIISVIASIRIDIQLFPATEILYPICVDFHYVIVGCICTSLKLPHSFVFFPSQSDFFLILDFDTRNDHLTKVEDETVERIVFSLLLICSSCLKD